MKVSSHSDRVLGFMRVKVMICVLVSVAHPVFAGGVRSVVVEASALVRSSGKAVDDRFRAVAIDARCLESGSRHLIASEIAICLAFSRR